MRREMAEKIAEMDGSSKANQIMLERSQDQMRELSAKVATLESHYAESQNQRAALESLYNDLSVSRDETALAEVEQMLLIAGQQLQLSANVKAALIAMQSADARLQRMDRTAFNGLRKAIGQDMVKLRALPNVDVAGINDRLSELMEGVDGMPLVYQQRVARTASAQPAPPKDETAWQRLLREIWQDIRQLVRIEDTGKAEIPLLPPEQEFFLRENLKMRFQLARLALLSRDEVAFRHELKTAQFWVARYFDAGASEGMKMQAGIKKLAAESINIELPDISSSLQAVRSYRLTRDSAADHGLQSRAPR
jgi:uroporphyrin-3 C-methyltransferase